tara:strand:- start:3 stop:263 length:261 start_codon:yes stop_codon:yes gene_type:complete
MVVVPPVAYRARYLVEVAALNLEDIVCDFVQLWTLEGGYLASHALLITEAASEACAVALGRKATEINLVAFQPKSWRYLMLEGIDN